MPQRITQNPNPSAIAPLLNIVNVFEDFKKSILNALSEHHSQLNELKKSLISHEARFESIFNILDNIYVR
jgi:flagellar capping protein FliD